MTHKKQETSKFIALILRHKPEEIGIALDEHGWANVDELIAGISKNQPFTMADLEEIVRTDEKQRYSFNEDKTLIRANQGHSIPVDVELEAVEPPKYLYHGTGVKYVDSIEKKESYLNRGWTFTFRPIIILQRKLAYGTENLLYFASLRRRWRRTGMCFTSL